MPVSLAEARVGPLAPSRTSRFSKGSRRPLAWYFIGGRARGSHALALAPRRDARGAAGARAGRPPGRRGPGGRAPPPPRAAPASPAASPTITSVGTVFISELRAAELRAGQASAPAASPRVGTGRSRARGRPSADSGSWRSPPSSSPAP